MAKKKTVEEVVTTEEVVEETLPVEATVAHVMQGGAIVRSYTKAEYGDEFTEHANTFVTTRDDSYSVKLA